MRVLFISANTEHMNIRPLPLGLNGVAVATRTAGHDVRLLDLMAEKHSKPVIAEMMTLFRPDVIGISVRNIDDQNMLPSRFLLDQVKEVVRDCRNLSMAPIVLGGAGYSIFPDSALNYLEADMGVQGEGEMIFPALLDRMQQGGNLSGTPGLYVRGIGIQGERQYVENLDNLPLPDIKMWSINAPVGDDFGIPVQSRRGCPMGCSYCSTATIEGRAIRMRSPALVVENMTRHVAAGYKNFYFVDNTFNLPLSYAKDICRRIIDSRMDITWRCIFYPGIVDPELVRLLAMAGCKEVALGFESGCESVLRMMNKKFTLDAIRRTSEMLRSGGIKQLGFLMLGGPGESRDSAEKSLAFADSLQLDAMKITIGIRIYPETALAKMAVADGLITPEDNLLFPRFYLVRKLGAWLRETIQTWMSSRPTWMT